MEEQKHDIKPILNIINERPEFMEPSPKVARSSLVTDQSFIITKEMQTLNMNDEPKTKIKTD